MLDRGRRVLEQTLWFEVAFSQRSKIEDLALVEFSQRGRYDYPKTGDGWPVTNKNCGVGGVIQLGVMDEGADKTRILSYGHVVGGR